MTPKFACPHCGEHVLLPETRRYWWRVVIILAASMLIVTALLLPPYGYSDYTTTTVLMKQPDIPTREQKHRAWRFVGYRFLLSSPPTADYDLREMTGTVAEANLLWFNQVTNMAVGWHIVAIEIASVLALTSAALFLRPTRKFTFQRKTTAAQPVKR